MIVEIAFAKRPTVVRAKVFEAKELTADMHKHDEPFVDLQQHFAWIGNVLCDGDFDEIVQGYFFTTKTLRHEGNPEVGTLDRMNRIDRIRFKARNLVSHFP